MKIVAFLQVYNEVAKGNLTRCLDNCKQWADDIVIYDDASTDNSVEVASRYTPHILRGEKNAIAEEQFHKAKLLEYALTLSPDWVMWIDCDEILCRELTSGGLRRLAEDSPPDVDAYSFPEWNLWRSQRWRRVDSLFATGQFCRLWRVRPGIRFEPQEGVHGRLYPATIEKVVQCGFPVIHYGFWDYRAMMVKIGAHWETKDGLRKIAPDNWILNETTCKCEWTPDELFPPENVPIETWPKPKPTTIENLIPYAELPQTLVRDESLKHWDGRHADEYHGNYRHIHERNVEAFNNHQPLLRTCKFSFDPKDKAIVDIGCGGGWGAVDCIAMGAKKVYCMEVSEGLIAQAKRSFEELGLSPKRYMFVLVDGKPWTPPEPVDIVYCMAVFMHIPMEEVAGYLDLTARILAPNGTAYFQLWQSEGKTLFHSDGLPGHETKVDDSVFDTMLRTARLTIREKQYPREPGMEPVWTYYVCGRGW